MENNPEISERESSHPMRPRRTGPQRMGIGVSCLVIGIIVMLVYKAVSGDNFSFPFPLNYYNFFSVGMILVGIIYFFMGFFIWIAKKMHSDGDS